MKQILIMVVLLAIVLPLGAHVAGALKGYAETYVEAVTQSQPRR